MKTWIAILLSLVAVSTHPGRHLLAKATLYLAEQVADHQQHHMLSLSALNHSLNGDRARKR